jgi:hypothetical protein
MVNAVDEFLHGGIVTEDTVDQGTLGLAVQWGDGTSYRAIYINKGDNPSLVVFARTLPVSAPLGSTPVLAARIAFQCHTGVVGDP